MLLAILAAALAYLAVLGRGPDWLRYLLKPGTMLLIIALAWSRADLHAAYDRLILAGLVASVAGDIFLMRPDRFLQGLVAFFAAHLLYLTAFTTAAPLVLRLTDALEVAWLTTIGLTFYHALRTGVAKKGGRGLLLPVALYIVVISLMFWRAMASGVPWAAAGAACFYLSDTLLAINRFARPLPYADHGVMATYYLAQTLIALTV